MARLSVTASGGIPGWIEVAVTPLEGTPQGAVARVSFYPDGDDKQFSMETTLLEGWEARRAQLEMMAQAFIRAAEVVSTRFPFSFFADEDAEWARPPCTLHVNAEFLHLLLYGVLHGQIGVDAFVLEPETGRFARLNCACALEDAVLFGHELQRELDAL